MSDIHDDDGAWIAFRQANARGVFRPLPFDWSARADELPTEDDLREIAAPVEANVALPGGDQGAVQGYLTGDGDLYVFVPQDLLENLTESAR